ncbi:hypothetical protein OHA72_61520 [Dactylosporangium sp. NBC_01737]|uniref:hypothetical protein n=1 Tax=Dactylosporangium sp. NBC_01737 TaxID=2975959 RepID=UPI002E12BC7F|nr:hypothetical protein OHA72_61520 [Dactylosporangium sp. NBC_01737]
MAARLRFAIIAPIPIEGRPVRIDASVGAATATEGTLDALLRAADAAMYREKLARRHPARVTA